MLLDVRHVHVPVVAAEKMSAVAQVEADVALVVKVFRVLLAEPEGEMLVDGSERFPRFLTHDRRARCARIVGDGAEEARVHGTCEKRRLTHTRVTDDRNAVAVDLGKGTHVGEQGAHRPCPKHELAACALGTDAVLVDDACKTVLEITLGEVRVVNGDIVEIDAEDIKAAVENFLGG